MAVTMFRDLNVVSQPCKDLGKSSLSGNNSKYKGPKAAQTWSSTEETSMDGTGSTWENQTREARKGGVGHVAAPKQRKASHFYTKYINTLPTTHEFSCVSSTIC